MAGRCSIRQTAQLMHGRQWNADSGAARMALGFYHEDRNGLNIIGHGGDTIFMHSDLHLFLDKNVGLFVSMNSAGKDAAVHPLREQLFEDFTDRYFPAPAQTLPTASTAKAQGEAMSGHYVSSRAGGFNFTRLLAILGQTAVGVDKDGILTASTVIDPSGNPRHWREIGPWTWQEVNGADKLQAIADGNGHVKMFSITPYAPIIEFLPAPGSLNAGWIIPAAIVALLVLLIAALGWPIVALPRRYKYQLGRHWPRTAAVPSNASNRMALSDLRDRLGAGPDAVNKDLTALNGGLDIWMRLLQLVLIAAIIGSILAVWNAVVVATAPVGIGWRQSGRLRSPSPLCSWPISALTAAC